MSCALSAAQQPPSQSAAAGPLLEAVQAEQSALAARVAPAIVAVEARLGPTGLRYFGSGVVLTPDGLVLTALSAAPPGARDIRARFADGAEFSADVIFCDPQTETVALRLASRLPKALPFLRLGDSDKLSVGSPVYAAGNPHDTLRRDGQVYWSAGTLTGRYVTQSADESSCYCGEVLETSAAVNAGCDGGALVDAQGKLLGRLSLCVSRARWMGTAVSMQRIVAAFPPELAATLRIEEPERRASGTDLGSAVPEALARAATRAAPALVRLRVPRRQPAPSEVPSTAACQAAPVEHGLSTPPLLGQRPDGWATGVLIEPSGSVLTSAFNVADAAGTIEAHLADGRRCRARLLGRHLDLDVALLRLEGVGPGSFPAPVLAGAPELRAGRFVAALGAPQQEGAGPTWTCGIVSATGRMGGLAVQMDAKTNYGNAGGPVVDLQGRLLGIVTQVGTRKAWAQNSGVGFFAPAERILEALPALRAGGVLRNAPLPVLGVAPAIGETTIEGVKLAQVVWGSPAWKAGLRESDIVSSLDDQPVRSWPALVALLNSRRAGDRLILRGLRGSQSLQAQLVLDARQP